MENNEKLKKQSEQEKRDIQSLRSGNTRATLETITQLRNRGSISILHEIFELMLITEEEELLDACVKLLNDIKNKEAVLSLVDAIADPKYSPICKELVASCWQSGLDYHEHLMVFVDVAIKADYATSLEAFTVIEDCIGQVEDNTRKKSIEKLKKELDSISEDKLPLIRELISMIERFQA